MLVAVMAIFSSGVFAAKSSKVLTSKKNNTKGIKCAPYCTEGVYTTWCGKKYRYVASCVCCEPSDIASTIANMTANLEGLCYYRAEILISVVPAS